MKIAQSPKLFWGLTAAVAVVGSGLIYSFWSGNGEIEARVNSLKTEVRDEKQVRSELEATKERVATLEQQLQHLEGGIPEAAYIPTLMGELEQFGNTNNIRILSVRPVFLPDQVAKDAGGKKKETAYIEQSIQVKGRGTYGDALRFVQALKRFPKIVAVRSMSLVPRAAGEKDKGSLPQLDVDIELKAFAYKQDQKRAGEEKAADES